VSVDVHDHLNALRKGLPRVAEMLRLENGAELRAWCKAVDTRLLTRFDPSFPLVAAVCGGGSSGKSTLFNALAGARVSPVGGRAGMNRRVLFSVPERAVAAAAFVAHLVDPSAPPPQPLRRPEDLLQPGGPLFVRTGPGGLDLILMDTPDFDTGARGHYDNRGSAQGSLEAADLLVYVFTNSNYNNRDNTDFISRMLTGIGRRPCVLVYRCYPGFTAEEVRDHAMTVARNLYGSEAERNVLGIFRADEDNRVAAGEHPVVLRPVAAGAPAFDAALRAIDIARLRREVNASMLADIVQQAGAVRGRAAASLTALRCYAAALRTVQGLCVQDALRHVPMDRVVRRFARIWADTDPPVVRFMRRTGSLIELPFRAVAGAAAWARGAVASAPGPESASEQFARRLEENLITGVTRLHQQALSPSLVPFRSPSETPGPCAEMVDADRSASAFPVAVHPAVADAQERLRGRDFPALLEAVLARREEVGDIGRDTDADLRALADRFRSRMGVWDRVAQTFWAALNVLPATAAVTYVLSTGDPVGAAAVKVKLASLFGLHDLYALVAIPVTRGVKQADRKQLEAMLGPIARAWLSHKFERVRTIFEQEITGDLLLSAERAAEEAERLLGEIDRSLTAIAEGR
jgi:hypothetical protein